MKRKFLAIMLSMTAVVCMAGCDGKEVESSTTTTAVATTEEVTTTTAEMTEETTTTTEVEEVEWPTSGFGSLIPKPEYGTITDIYITETMFIASIDDFPADKLDDYSDHCIEAGFAIDASKDKNGLMAKNKDGHELILNFYPDRNHLGINIFND